MAAAADSSSRERERAITMARIARRLGRFSDMMEIVNGLARLHTELTCEEKNLLCVAYNNQFSVKLGALRELVSIAEEEDDEEVVKCIKKYHQILEKDVKTAGTEALNVLEHDIVPYASATEDVITYHKMIGDISWLMCMMKKINEESKGNFVAKALTTYKIAYEASKALPRWHPQRLCLSLNLSAFYYDMMKDRERAMEVANHALIECDTCMTISDESSGILALIIENMENKWSQRESKEFTSCSVTGTTSEPKIQDLLEDNEHKDTISEAEQHDAAVNNEPVAVVNNEPVAVVNHEHEPGFNHGFRPPSPVIRHHVPPSKPDNFTGLSEWGHQTHQGLSKDEIRRRRKSSQAMRGCMG